MDKVIETIDASEFGLFKRSVRGLNIFSANGLRRETLCDPRIVFLRTVSNQFDSSLHIGSVGLNDIAEEPEEIFGRYKDSISYARTNIGLEEGNFYASPGDDRNCFFPNVPDLLWDVHAPDGEGIQYLVESGAIALYVGDIHGNATQMMLASLSRASTYSAELVSSQEHWLRFAAGLYKLVIVVGHDGLALQVYAINRLDLDMVSEATAKALAAITTFSWYGQNASHLQWDNGYGCLKVSQPQDNL